MRVHTEPTLAALLRPSLLLFLGGCLAGSPIAAHAQERGFLPEVQAEMADRIAATTHCTGCHAIPRAEHLDRATWEKELLPKMRILLGLTPPTPNSGFQDIEVLKQEKVFPDKPMLSEAAFESASRHFLRRAPEMTGSQQNQEKISVGLKHFRFELVVDRHAPPLTTFVHIDPDRRELLLGDAGFQGYNVLNHQRKIIAGHKIGNIPVSIVVRPDEHWLVGIGHFFPREEKRGQVLRLLQKDGVWHQETVLSDLPRPTHLALADLNGDGLEDMVLCMYGNYVGRFSWFEQLKEGGWKEHLLFDKPGALRSRIVDIDGDGHLDIVVLVAQWTEALFIFKGNGKGEFTRHQIYQKDPSWGHSGFELADFNKDGLLDLLVTNGDNADFNTSPTRPHHGVRILLNRGNWKFEEVWFGPMNGAYRAVARDFDGDGDLDIAAISFFPDYKASPRESFIYFDNNSGSDGDGGTWKFDMSTFQECIMGRWLTLDAGDLDGDGDEDLVLGSLIQMPTEVPPFLKELWQDRGPSVVILRNKTRSP